MSHTWQSRSSKARQRTQRRKRQITRIRQQLSSNERANFSAEEVRTLVEQMRSDGVNVPRLRDEQEKQTGELSYGASGGGSQ